LKNKEEIYDRYEAGLKKRGINVRKHRKWDEEGIHDRFETDLHYQWNGVRFSWY
jgi:hypothetical protein